MALFAIQLGTVAVETLFQLFWMSFLMIVSSVQLHVFKSQDGENDGLPCGQRRTCRRCSGFFSAVLHNHTVRKVWIQPGEEN